MPIFLSMNSTSYDIDIERMPAVGAPRRRFACPWCAAISPLLQERHSVATA
jgi:hypothetical protein